MWQRTKYIRTILVLLLMATGLSAQSHGVEIAPRIGVGMTTRSGQLHSRPGLLAGAELDYSFRTKISPHAIAGLRVGLGFSRCGTTIVGTTEDRYTNYDYQGRRMDYYNRASITDKHVMYRVELPLMAALNWGGITLHTGLKLQWNVADRSELTLTDPVIAATYADYGVTLVNRLVTGVLTESPYRQSGTFSLPKGRLQWGGELGYEWLLHQGFYHQQRLGVAVGVWCNIAQFAGTDGSDRVIDVAPIRSSVSPAPAVTVCSPVAQESRLRGLEFAVRLTYAIESIDYQGYGWHNRRTSNRIRRY